MSGEISAPRAHAGMLQLLSGLLADAPDTGTLKRLCSPPLRDMLAQAGLVLPEGEGEPDLQVYAEAAAVDFADLFLIPKRLISPHESVQIEGGSGLLRGPESAAVAHYYRAMGFERDESRPMEADHISVELEFLAHLCEAEARFAEAGEGGRALDAVRFQRDFLTNHLGAWADHFLERAAQRAAHAFYRGVLGLAREFLNAYGQDLERRTTKAA